MVYCLILCRSLTHAQRTARVLERSSIKNHIIRTPRSIASEGCGYSVKLPEEKIAAAIKALKSEGFDPKKLYRQSGNGGYNEVLI